MQAAADHPRRQRYHRRPGRTLRVRGWAAAWLCALLLAATPLHAAGLGETETRDLQLLISLVREPKLDLARRREAAQSLLDRGWSAADSMLVGELMPGGDTTTQRAVVQALAGRSQPLPAAFAAPLLDLLARADGELAQDVAAALSRSADPLLARKLAEIAVDPVRTAEHRRGATLTLGHYRSQSVTKVLIQLIEPDETPMVRDAAFASLAQLTGISEFGSDFQRWTQWWSEAQKLTQQRWLLSITENFARRAGALSRQNQQLEERAVELQRQLYWRTATEERPAVLVAMLGDPVEGTRRLATELLRQRLDDQQKITPEMRTALVARLDDEAPALRQAAARLLRVLRDETGADAVAQRLVSRQEKHREVLRAYLALMADLPRLGAVDRAMELLSDSGLRGDAAGVLARAADAKLLGAERLAMLRARLAPQVTAPQPPEPKVIELLGRVADEDDWQRIAQWMDHADAAVKQAAARAWAQSDRPLLLLMNRAGDPQLQAIAIDAATLRGQQPETLLALIQHRPQQEQQAQAWQRAIRSLAARVPPEGVLIADRKLDELREPLAVREEVLSAALERLPAGAAALAEVEPAVLANLLMARAEVRLASGSHLPALQDLALVVSSELKITPAQQERRGLLALRARLAGGDVEGALDAAAEFFRVADGADTVPAPETLENIARLVLDAAQRHLTTDQVDSARRLFSGLTRLTNGTLPDALRERARELELVLAPAATPAPTPTPRAPETAPAPPAAPQAPAPPATQPASLTSAKSEER